MRAVCDNRGGGASLLLTFATNTFTSGHCIPGALKWNCWDTHSSSHTGADCIFITVYIHSPLSCNQFGIHYTS